MLCVRKNINQMSDVALRYYQPAQVLVNNTTTGNQYVFVVQHNVSMAFVDKADVANLLNRRGGCCNKKRRLFGLASDDIVRVWQEGGRP